MPPLVAATTGDGTRPTRGLVGDEILSHDPESTLISRRVKGVENISTENHFRPTTTGAFDDIFVGPDMVPVTLQSLSIKETPATPVGDLKPGTSTCRKAR